MTALYAPSFNDLRVPPNIRRQILHPTISTLSRRYATGV